MNSREKWEQELQDRQRNVVFPDTVRNEAQAYRDLVTGKAKFTGVRAAGIIILWGTALLSIAFLIIFVAIQRPPEALRVVLLYYGLAAAGLYSLAKLVAWSGWRSVRREREKNPHPHHPPNP